MVKMKKHILYIALGLLALIAIITTVLAIGGVVTLPVIGQPAIEQPAVSDSQPHGPTAAARSYGKLDFPAYTNGTLLNMWISQSELIEQS